MTQSDLLHGGALDCLKTLYPQAPEPWIDLSTGLNPHPYPIAPLPPEIFAHLPSQNRYQACHGSLARYYGAPPESLMLVPGTELLIRLLPQLLQIQTVAIADPTYGDHQSCWQRAGAKITLMADPTLLAGKVDAIVLCNPNNPDGRTWSPESLEDCRVQQAASQGWLIVDEAYADLVPSLSLAARGGEAGLIVLRSFGKFFGLAGLRLGALIGPAAVLTAARDLLGVWPVSGPALHVAKLAADDPVWPEMTRKCLELSRSVIDKTLTDAGLTVRGGTSLFCYVEVPDAHTLWHRLAGQGVYTRRFAWSDRHLRIGLPADDAGLSRLAGALAVSL
ncbi:MAG: threonine-phosphate decarboxylase CobD [Hyphomonas sp.]